MRLVLEDVRARFREPEGAPGTLWFTFRCSPQIVARLMETRWMAEDSPGKWVVIASLDEHADGFSELSFRAEEA